ncbi:hypothetical protein ACU3L3_06815 [Priestia endophytica]
MQFNDIFGLPTEHEDVGNIYPILVKDSEEFDQYSGLLAQGKQHFPNKKDTPLLECIYTASEQEATPLILAYLGQLFKLVLRVKEIEIKHDGKHWYYLIEGSTPHVDSEGNVKEKIITVDNYDSIREIIMKQNLIVEPRFFKDPRVAKKAQSFLETKAKGGIEMTMEDKITTVSVWVGKTYEELSNYTIYQLESEFGRICQLADYQSQVLMMTNPHADLKGVKFKHFAEKLNLMSDPFEGFMKKKGDLSVTKALE